MANPLLKYAKDKKTSQSDYQQTNQGAQNPARTDGSQTGTGNTNPLLKYANSVSSAPAAPSASIPGAADVSSPSTSPSSDSLSALKKQREDIYNSIDRRRAEMDRKYANDVYKQLTEIDGKIDRIENPGREDAGEAYRKAKRTYEAELAYGDADTRAAAKKALEEKKADFSAAGGNPDATIVGSALKEYAGSLATGFGVLSATSGLGGMNPEELPADYEMQRALLDQARKNSSGQNDEINSIVERGQKLVEEGAMGVESAKAGRSAAGKFLVDLAVQATMMGGDMLLGLATGGGMAPLIARAYGGSVNEAIADGADYNMASLYGAAAAATEAFTERMFDGFSQIYGHGDSTKLVSYVSGKLAKTDAGRLAWQYIINGMGEGVEEVVSDLVNPLIKTIYNGKKLSQNYKDLNIGDIAYDFIVGAALGYSGVAVEAIGGAGMSDTAKFFSDAAHNGMSFKEACKLYDAMWTAYDEWVSRETDGKNAGYTDPQNAAGVNSGLFAEEDIVEGSGEYVDAEENVTNNAPTANEAEASGMTAKEYAKTLEQTMQPVQQEADIQAEQQSTPAVQQVEQENDIASAFDPFYNGDVINAGAVEEAVQNGTFPVEAIESIPVDKDIRNDKTTTNELIERGQREYAEKLAAQEAPHTQQEATQSVQSGSNISATPTQENASQKPQASAVAPVSAEKQRAISAAESYGESGRVPFSLLVGDDMGTKLDSVRVLTPKEREEAYLRGKKRAESKAQKKQDQRDAEANGNTGWRRGNVIGDGVKISDMKETFNDPQGLSYTILSTISDVTGIDIILYRSEAENGEFTMYEGKFKKSTDQIYIDLNSGLIRSMDADQLSKYVMLRTFGHELTHFDEKWSPVLYNEFRQAVFEHMEKNGTDVDALIREQQDNGMSYEAASREVVADAMTDVLPDSNFVEMLAKEHRTLFQRILDKLKEFVAKVKEAFAKMVPNNKAAANAMKENVDGTLRYAQNIVDLFDRMTVDAVERYQRARATKETVATTEEAVEADAGGTKETRTPVSLNALIAKAETYADDKTGKQQLSQLIKDAYDRGKNRKRVTVDDILSAARDIVDTDTGKEQLAGLIEAAYLRGQSNAQNDAESDKTVNSELYKHFFEGSTPEEAMDALKKVGFNRWQKNGKDRLYINADSLGLEITWGKRMGHVESASFQGEDISKSYASELRSAKTYVDVKTQEIIGTDEKLKEIATNLYMETLTKAYEDAVNSSANAQPVKTAAPAVETTSSIAEETAPTETAASAEETAPESKPTVEEAKANLKKSIKVPVETTNAKALEHGIKTETLSIDSVTFGTPPAGFNSMQQQAIASGLIDGVYKDEKLIKLDVPYDGQFTIENTVQNVVRILEKLHVKANQEATITKELARLLKKGGAVARSGDVYFAGTNKVMLRVDKDTYDFAMSPKYEGGYDAMPHTFGESFVDNLKKDGPAPVPVVADISAGAGFGGEYYVFDVSGEKVYFRKSDVSLIDGNGRTLYIEKVKSNGFYASTFDENGVCGIITNVRLESPTTVYTKPSNLKCFKKTNNTNKEAKTNGEETEGSGSGESPVRSDNVGAVPVSESDGEGAGESGLSDLISAEVRALKNSEQPEHRTAYRILTEYLRDGKQLTSKDLYAIADTEFGGTQAQGGYDRKDAYDAMELAVNRYLFEIMPSYNSGSVANAVDGLQRMEQVLSLLPTQSVRTEEQVEYQQFSTPPNIAYLAAWTANVKSGETVLEPSAGIGGLAVFPKAWGANVTVNELSERRLAIIKGMNFAAEYNENAEYIDDILPDEVKPTLVIMNPPFSSTAGRLKAHKTSNAEKHINSALARLSDGGRLVAILGKGMNDSDYSRYWNDLRQSYTIRANISIDGYNYRKYGTNYDIQLVVIDKIGSQGNAETFTGSYKDLAELPAILEVIRNERRTAEQPADQSGVKGPSVPAKSGRMENADSAVDLVRNRDAGIVPGRDGAYPGAVGKSGVSSEYEADAAPVSAADAGNAGDSRPRSDLQPGEAESAGEKSPESKKPGKSSTGGRGTPRNAGNERGTERAGSGAESARSGSVNSAENATGVSEERSDDGVYADYTAPTLPVTGAKKHPARLVESAAMSAVSMPPATYIPALPKEVVENNLSDAQMVSVVYAGQAHSQVLPSGERKGFFIGDGTGVGKGRQISGIILDNILQGRKKAVWISKNASLFPDAQRDWVDTTGRSKDEVHDFSKIKLQDSISFGDGILFSTYDTLRVEKGEHSRLKQIADWLGKDFDGVIAFDEAHNMGNLLGKQGSRGKTKGSEKARAAVELQKMLPNARVVYVSATAATEVEGLAFASRLGLWGTGTPFYDVKEFVNQIGSAGLSAMELVVRDMKALGVYDARSISYNGVAYDTVLHNLDETQRYIYDEMSRAWQNVMRNVEQYLKSTGAYNNSQARSTAIGQFYSSMQRFYNQVLTSMSMPSVIADMKKELAAGRSCVLQIVNTNQAEADRQIASIKAENGSLDDMDLTPRSALIGYLESCFPVYKFEEYLDDNGNIRSRQVLDSQGQPVIDKAAVRKRDALIAEINEMSIPDGPLEMLFNAFGTDKVAEVTGRSRRVVPKLMDDGSVTRVEESRTKNSTEADVTAFQDGKKRILVFSDAGGTGKSYHASLTAKNQQQRVHYVLQPGWIASNAVQGFGRTHRSNEASAPIYKLVTTDIKGQKRFTSTIARRLDQLGALTKGQRNTGSGMFGANDNLETDLAKDSLREFYRRLGTGSIEGVDGKSVLQKLGLLSTFTDEFGRFKLDENVARDVSKFLNRILALEVDEQNEVFDAFTGIYETELENAIAAGTLDTGMENVKADKVDIVDDKVINTQKGTGAETHYIQAKVYTRPKIIRTVAEASEIRQAGFVGFYKTKNGDVRSVYRMPDKTDIYGKINKQYRLYSPTGKYSTWKESTLESSAEQIAKKDWQREWDAEIKKAPEFNEETVHMLTGALLPVWNKLPSDGITKVKRILADDGTAYLGRIIGADKIDGVLSLFSASRTHEAYTGEIISQRVLDGKRIFLTNGRAEFFRSRVSGEWRIEYTQSNSFMIPRIYPEMIMERINYQNRYFVPVSEKGKALIDKIIANNPVSREANAPAEEDEQYSRRSSSMTDRDILEMAADMVDESDYTDGEKDALRIFKERLTTLQDLTEQREDMGKTYREQQFGKPADRKGAEQTLARMKIIDGRIEKARNAVLDVESKPVLRDVLSKSRKILEEQGKAATKAALNKLRAKTRESAGVKKYRQRIADDVADITKWITNPSNKSSLDRVPDAIKNPVIDFLNALNFTSKRALKGGAATKADAVVMARAKRLSEAMKKGFDVNEAYARYELPDDFFDRMDDFIRAADAYASAGEFTINEMTAQELKVLSGLVKNLKKFIRQVNAFHQNAIFEHVSEASQSSMEFMRELGEAKRDGNLDNFLLWQNLRPAYGFERFGRGGEAIWDELRRGQDKLAFNTVEISDFVKQTYTPEQVKEWSETVEVFEIGDEKEPVSIPVAYLMGLYELSKDPDGARHILEGGIRVAPFTVGKNRVTNNGVDMTQLSLSEMVDRLKKKYPEAAETADKMQRFMARTGGKMANEVSMARFGEEMFTNENYYPISSDGRLFDVSADKPYDNQNLYALLNMSFTKNRIEGANNRVVIYNIFDVFSNHMSGVATYNALALPVLDTLKWLNYRETVINETGDVVKGERLTEVMDRTFGGGNDEAPGSNARGYATKFVLDIVRSYNGTTPQSSPIDRFAINALHHYNVAQVAFNGRVVIQQPLAIVRAGMYLNIGDITGAIASFRKGKAYYTEKHNEMLRNSGIAAWKDLGFYDVNISRGLTELIKQDDSKVDKLNDFGLKAAEAADSVTWTAIWVASEKAAERKGFTPDSERYMEEVVRIFEEVIYKTQVVDSVLTKTAWLRDKGAVARATGSFMNEPVTTYNLLEDAYDKFNMDKRRGMSNQQAWQKNGKRIARIAMIYGLTALTNAMITAMADAWRDDDDYQTALEKWWEAFRGNIVDELIPFNKLPLVSEAYDLILMTLNKMGLDVAGYEPNSFLFQWSDDWLKAVEIISDKMKGEDTNYTWYAGIYYLLRAVSGMTAVPLGSITREVSDIWNNSVGALAPSLKLITYDPGVKNSIKYALWDGYLTEAEAADELVKAGIMNAADAREQARHWAYANSNPDSTLTLTQLSNYDKYASPAGISIEEYENFLLSIKDYKGDTKKERIVEKINAMPVSERQKDAYFYAAGYKSSTLEQTPWHFDMSGWQIDDYKKYGAPAGISKETFKTFTETASKIKGDDKNGDGKTDSGSKKAKVIAYIDGLSLTPDQKDALYYQQGYAESKIGDTPWH